METQESIGTWNLQTFGPSDPSGKAQALRLLDEVCELCLAAGASPAEMDRTYHKASWPDGSTNLGERARRWSVPRPEPGKVAEELADCHIVLRSMAHRLGVDLDSETDKKMFINRNRKWQLAGDGTGSHRRHVEEG